MSKEEVVLLYSCLDALMEHLHDLPTDVLESPWIEWVEKLCHQLAAYGPTYQERINSGMFLEPRVREVNE